MLLGGLQKAWEAVSSAVNVIWDWIQNNIIKPAMDAVLSPIYNVLNSISEECAKILFDLYTSKITLEKFFDNLDSALSILMMLSTGIAMAITGLQMILMALQYAIPGGQVLSLITSMILSATVQQVSKEVLGLIAGLTVSAIVGLLMGYFAPADSPAFQISVASGVTIASYLTYMGERLLCKKKAISIVELNDDFKALGMCIFSLWMVYMGEAMKEKIKACAREAGYDEETQELCGMVCGFAADSYAVMLSVTGTYIALTSSNPLESSFWGWLDEGIDLFSMSYDVGTWLSDIEEIVSFSGR
jgi:hypothetical protein